WAGEKVVARGGRRGRGVTMTSAFPSRSMSAAVMTPPPVKSSLPLNGAIVGMRNVLLFAPLITAKRMGAPGPVIRIVSGVPSPFTSATVVRTLVRPPANGLKPTTGAGAYCPAAFGANPTAEPSGGPLTTIRSPAWDGEGPA